MLNAKKSSKIVSDKVWVIFFLTLLEMLSHLTIFPLDSSLYFFNFIVCVYQYNLWIKFHQ